MKILPKKFLLGFILSISFLLFPIDVILAALPPLPVPRTPLNQRDRFQTDLFSGSANYSFPLNVPKGTNDLTPEVTLSYSSSGVQDLKTYLGIGWQLNMDYIERDINYSPGSTSDDSFKLHFKGSIYDLVYVSGESRYHTKTESNLNIQKLTGGSNDYGDYWQVITPDGTKYRFGYATGTELVCNGRSYVASWNLDLITDTHDNKIYYSYLEDNGISYLSQIKYNNDQTRIIDFTYGTNPYEHPVYSQGCHAYDLKRLTNIQVKISTTLVREYDFAFGQTGNTQPVLDSITEKGNDHSPLPSTVFYYKPEIHTWQITPELWIDNADIDVHLQLANVVLADANGDGLLDIVKSEGAGNVSWYVWKNTGSNWNTSRETWVNNSGLGATLTSVHTRLVDVTGDSLPDIVKSEAGNSGGRSYWYVWRNTGTSWNTTQETWVYNNLIDAYFGQTDVKVIDVTGDGFADIVKTNHDNNSSWFVHRNTGSNSWSTDRETWFTGSIDAHLEDPNVRLVDVNGDALPDIVKTTYDGNYTTWYVWKNTGNAWGSQTTWLAEHVNAHLERSDTALADVNGDGLLDIVKSDELGTADKWKVLYNRGGSWTSTYETWIDTSSNLDLSLQDNTQMADVSGDGMADIIKSDPNGGYDTWRVWKNNGNSPHLLASIQGSQGSIISFDYEKASTYDNKGTDSIADLPFNLWVVKTMTVNNGLSGDSETEDTTTYSYKSGFYKWQDHEFRGFGEVSTVEPNGSKKKYIFNQDDATKGTLSELYHNNSSNNPYTKIENTWSNSLANGIYTVNLTSEKEYTYDGSASNPKIKQTDYTYDSYGNITKKSEKGDNSISSDDRFIYNEYVYNTTDWIVNTSKHVYKNSSDDTTKVNESWFYYDGHSNLTDSPTDGSLTRKIDWLNGGTNPETLYEYDSYGNLIETTDDNSNTTTYTYNVSDTTRTYPERITNAKDQQTSMTYDLGTGNILTKTDPNGQTITYMYDVFGRLTKEIKPYDSSTYPTVKYQYFTDGVDGVLTSRREASGSAGTYDSYKWVDGLGRTVQTRTEAEDTSKQIVVDMYYSNTGQPSKVTVPYEASNADYYASASAGIRATETSYDTIGRVLSIENPKGDDKTLSYDHWKETIIDENGHTKHVYKNAYDKITQVEEVNSGNTYTTSYAYNPMDLLTQVTDEENNDTTFTYDTLGRKTSQTDPDMGTWEYTYDGIGNVITQTDNRDITITKSYDELNRLTGINYPTSVDTAFSYDLNSKIGTLSIATDSAGVVSYAYDNRLRKTQEQRTIDGTTKTTSWTYDPMDRIITLTNPDSETITYGFNAQGEVDNASNLLTDIDYNALGKITHKSYQNGLATNYTYNTNDFRLNRIQTGTHQDLNYTYDNVGNIQTIQDDILDKTQTFEYDNLDRLTAASESGGFNQTYSYSPLGNLTSFVSSGDTTTYTYGQNGKVHAQTASSEITTLQDPPAPSTPFTASLSENWESGAINQSKWNDWSGGQASIVSGKLRLSSTTGGGYYGVDSELDGKTYNLTGSSLVTQLINAGNQSIGSWEVYPLYAYVSGDSSTQYFFYISENTLRAYKKVSGTNTILATTTYNSTNHKWFRIRETGGTTYFDTSTNGISWSNFASTTNAFTLTSLVVGSEVGTWSSEGSSTYAELDNFNYATPPSSTLTEDWASGSINSSKWVDWSGGQAAVSAGKLVLSSTTGGGYYGVDSGNNTYSLTNSQIVTKLENAGNQSIGSWEVYPIYAYVQGDASTQYFWYISENTLRAYKKVSGTNTILATTTYNSTNHKWFRIRETGGITYFDTSSDGATWNNFASTTNAFALESLVIGAEVGTWSSEGSSTTATLDNFNVWTPIYTYDANGNMTSDGHLCYEFNDSNQLYRVKNCGTGHTIAVYVYDYNGNRMIKNNYVNNTLNNTVISWSDSFETKTVTGESTQSTTYYFINSELVAKKNPDSSRYYFHNDHLSSSTIVTNSGGTPIEQTKYDPWGDILSGGTKSKFLYTGQEKDTETNLNYYNARYYSSDMRRFTQPDDIYPDLYNPQTLNRYSYVNNNPLRYTDPSGHIFKELFNAVVGYVVGKAINHYVSTIFMPAPKIQSVPVSNTSNSKQTGAVPNTNGSRNTKSGNYTVPKAPTGISLTDNVQQAYNNRLNPLWFPSMVRSNGAWDYKSTHGIDSADFGNYNYGATGKASGYSSNTLKGAAGLVQQFEKYKNIFVGRESAIPTKGVPFLVDPNGDAVDSLGFSKDQYMIEQGFSSY